jgi:hypothetical protein
MSYLKNQKTEEDIPDDLGAKELSPLEADPRDFKVEHTIGIPTDEELKQIPKRRNLIEEWLDHTYNQAEC